MTEPHAVRLNDLLAAIKLAGDRLQVQYAAASTETSRVAYAGGMFALHELRTALTPERDGAGETHPSEAPPEPAPSPAPGYWRACGALHPWMGDAFCTLDPHPDTRHEAQSADAYRTVVAWSV